MSMTKCYEDNIKIMEDRFYMRHTTEELYQMYRTNRVYFQQTTIESKEKIKKERKRNREIICLECGETFLFTGGEQHFYEKHDLSDPKRCPRCRRARKEFYKEINQI